jgi:DNA-binding beta-propeller fold protein YncE
MSVSPDGRVIYVAVSDFLPRFQSSEDKIVAIDVQTNTVLREYFAGGNPERLGTNPAGTQIWASLEAIAQGAGYDIEKGNQFVNFRVGIEAEGIAVSPNGRWVYVTAEATHTITIFDTEELKVLKHILVGNRPRVVIFFERWNTCVLHGRDRWHGIYNRHEHTQSHRYHQPRT